MIDSIDLPQPPNPEEITYPTPLVAEIAAHEPESVDKYRHFLGFLREGVTIDQLIYDRVAQANIVQILHDKLPDWRDEERNNPYIGHRIVGGTNPKDVPRFMLKDEDGFIYYMNRGFSFSQGTGFVRDEDIVPESMMMGPMFPKRRIGAPGPYNGTVTRISVDGGRAEMFDYKTQKWEPSFLDDCQYAPLDKEELGHSLEILKKSFTEGASDYEFGHKSINSAMEFRFDRVTGEWSVPSISEMLGNLSETERRNLLEISVFKSLLQSYFEERMLFNSYDSFQMRLNRENFPPSMYSPDLFASRDLGVCTYFRDKGVVLTAQELQAFLGQGLIPPQEFIDRFPQESYSPDGIDGEGVESIRQYISQNFHDEVERCMDQPLEDIVADDYVFTANALLQALYVTHPEYALEHYKMMVAKARALGQVAGYELDETDVHDALGGLFDNARTFYLGEAENAVEKGGIYNNPYDIFVRNIAKVLDLAVEIGEDVSFAKPYFAEAQPYIIKRLKDKWWAVKQNDLMIYRNEYEAEKNNYMKWAKIVGRNDMADEIGRIEST